MNEPEEKMVNVTARYRRQRQPQSYEAAEAELSVTAVFTQAEANGGAAARLLASVKADVLAAVGLSGPAPAEAASAPAQVATPAKRGRPAKASAAGEVKPAEQAVAEQPAAQPTDIDFASDDFMAEEPAPAPKPISDDELMKAASTASGKVGPAKVRELMKQYGIQRLSELAADKRPEFIEKAKNLA